MKLTVLGNNGPYPGANGACSGYLLECGETRILLDCGSGVLSRFQEYCRLEDLTHIILSHLHYDHMNDMMVLRYAIESHEKRGKPIDQIKLYLPAEPKETYDKITSKGMFDTTEIAEDLNLNIAGLQISFKRVNHPLICFAVKVQEHTKTFVYSGDTAYTPAIIELAKSADLFLCDSGLLSKDKKAENAPHFTAYEAGAAAKEAGVKRLLLTHFFPKDDTSQHLKEARENYPEAELAVQGNSYEI